MDKIKNEKESHLIRQRLQVILVFILSNEKSKQMIIELL